jgi:DNA-binding NarL/FixJ family response regulator
LIAIKEGTDHPLIIPEVYLKRNEAGNLVETEKIDHFLQIVERQYQIINKVSARELECIRLCAKGKSAKKIAKEIFLSPRTVEAHLSNAKKN